MPFTSINCCQPRWHYESAIQCKKKVLFLFFFSTCWGRAVNENTKNWRDEIRKSADSFRDRRRHHTGSVEMVLKHLDNVFMERKTLLRSCLRASGEVKVKKWCGKKNYECEISNFTILKGITGMCAGKYLHEKKIGSTECSDTLSYMCVK